MAVTDLQLYLVLKEKFGERDAQTVVAYMAMKVNEAKEKEINLHAKKAGSNIKKWERIATVTIIVVYLLVIGLCFMK